MNFTGYMKVSLDSTLSDDDIIKRLELVGDWKTKSNPNILVSQNESPR